MSQKLVPPDCAQPQPPKNTFSSVPGRVGGPRSGREQALVNGRSHGSRDTMPPRQAAARPPHYLLPPPARRQAEALAPSRNREKGATKSISKAGRGLAVIERRDPWSRVSTASLVPCGKIRKKNVIRKCLFSIKRSRNFLCSNSGICGSCCSRPRCVAVI